MLNRVELYISENSDPEIATLTSELKAQEAANSSFAFSDNSAQVQKENQALSAFKKYFCL